jgi:hypothetical protein
LVDKCKELGLPNPTYRLAPNEDAPSFFTGAAFFPSTAPEALVAEEGIGAVYRIHSKNKAKTAICINVLQELNELQGD